jgi:DNA topoisomerase VI subunit B
MRKVHRSIFRYLNERKREMREEKSTKAVLARIAVRIEERAEELQAKNTNGNPHITAALIAIETVKNAILEELLSV